MLKPTELTRLSCILSNIKTAKTLLPDFNNQETKKELEAICEKGNSEPDTTVDFLRTAINLLEVAEYKIQEKLNIDPA